MSTNRAGELSSDSRGKQFQTILPKAFDPLNTGGRLAVISYHSVEDRITKTSYRKNNS